MVYTRSTAQMSQPFWGSNLGEGGRGKRGYGGVHSQNESTRGQADDTGVFYASENPKPVVYRLIDHGDGECWPEWGKEEEECSAQPTAPERENARTNGRHRRVPSTRKPPC